MSNLLFNESTAYELNDLTTPDHLTDQDLAGILHLNIDYGGLDA